MSVRELGVHNACSDTNGLLQAFIDASDGAVAVLGVEAAGPSFMLCNDAMRDLQKRHTTAALATALQPRLPRLTGLSIQSDPEPSTFECYLPGDGRGGTVLAWTIARLNFPGCNHCLLVAARDITDERSLERKLEEANDRIKSLEVERDLMRTVMDALPDELFVKNVDQKLLLLNRAAMDFMRIDPQQVADGLYLSDVFPPTVIEQFMRDEAPVVGGREDRKYTEFMRMNANGELKWVAATIFPLTSPEGQIRGVVGYVRDVSDYKFAAQKLADEQTLMRMLMDNLPISIFFKDVNGNFLISNEAHARLVGASSSSEVTGRKVTDFFPPEFAEEMEEADRRILETGEPVTDKVYRMIGRPPYEWMSATKLPVLGASGSAIGILGIVQDITHQKQLESERERILAEAIERAERDPLTGLLNHRSFHQRLDQLANECSASGNPYTLVMLDLDNFKFFNDAYGHVSGDGVLCAIARILQEAAGDEMPLARLGGDDFALLLPNMDTAQAKTYLEHIQSALSDARYRPAGYNWAIPLDISIGIAVCPDDSEVRADLMSIADQRRKDAKYGSEGSAHLIEQLKARLSGSFDNFSMLNALVSAVDNKDRYTRQHSEDVLTYSVQIARQLDLDDDTVFHVKLAALLHDVGKIGVPDDILRKPGKLTDEEFAAIKQHPTMGAIMVNAVPGFEATLDAVRFHHERWDGGGYPSGLAGEQIPLLGRLMAVADAFSAMTTDRPYRKAMDNERAMEILRRGSGSQWDPVCVDAFIRARTREA